MTSQMEISPSLSLSFSLSFVFPEFEQASEGCRQIGAESCHFKPFLQAYLKGLRGPSTVYWGPPRASNHRPRPSPPAVYSFVTRQ